MKIAVVFLHPATMLHDAAKIAESEGTVQASLWMCMLQTRKQRTRMHTPKTSPPSMSQPPPRQCAARKHIITELLQTEKTYSAELSRFVEGIIPKLESGEMTATKQYFFDTLTGLVGNLEQFLHVSRTTVLDLEDCEEGYVGSALGRLSTVLPLYTQYATNYANARQHIRHLTMQMSDFVSKEWEYALRNDKRKTSLEGFLILPVQRIPRYSLLLVELLKTFPSNTATRTTRQQEEYDAIERALQETDLCAANMDNAIAEVQRVHSLEALFDSIQSPSQELETLLLLQNNVNARIVQSSQLTNCGNGKKYTYVLVSSNPPVVLCLSQTFHVKRMIKLQQCCFVSAMDARQFTVTTVKDYSMHVECKSTVERDMWVDSLQQCIALCALSNPMMTAVSKSNLLRQIMSTGGGDDKECSLCAAKFTFLSRKQICGRCLRDVCASCSPQRRYLSSPIATGVGAVHRVCECCAEEMDFCRAQHCPQLLRLAIHLTIHSDVDYYWSVSQHDVLFGPNIQGKFLLTIPMLEEGNVITIHLNSHHGATRIASHVVNVCDLVNHPRISQGFTQRIGIFLEPARDNANPVLVTFALQPAPDLFLQPEENSIRVAASDAPAPPANSSSGGSFRLNATRRKSVDSVLFRRPSFAAAPTPTTPPSSSIKSRKRFNLRLFKEIFESKAQQNKGSLYFTRLVEVILNWAIRNAMEGSEIQAFYAQLLYRFHVQAAQISRQPSQFSLPQFVVEETLYVKKLESIVDRHRSTLFKNSNSSSSSVRRGSISASPSSPATVTVTSIPSPSSSFAKVKQVLASSFGQPISEREVFQFPQVANCLSAIGQMVTVHKSFLNEVTHVGFEALHRFAALAKVYSSYGTHIAECYMLILFQLQLDESKANRKVIDLLPCSGCAEEDAEAALKWLMLANGILRPSPVGTMVTHWTLLDLLLAPLQRMNEYCEFARETASSSLPALLDTRRFLVKSMLKRANMRLLREIDSVLMMTASESSLVDGRRWFLRGSVMCCNADEVVVLLFSDQLIVCKPRGLASWEVLHRIVFAHPNCSVLRTHVEIKPEATTAAGGDSRFAFELDSLLFIVPKAIRPFPKQFSNTAWNQQAGMVVGPGGFRAASLSSSLPCEGGDVVSTPRSLYEQEPPMEQKQTKLKRAVKQDWVADLRRVLDMWDKLSLAGEQEVCWMDDIIAWNLLHGSATPRTSSAREDFDML